jgi:hypothetical protein
MEIKKCETGLIVIEDYTENSSVEITLTMDDVGSIISLLSEHDLEKVQCKLDYLQMTKRD